MDCFQETALQLLARTQQRPSLEGLHPFLFGSGPKPKEIIEITGKSGTGKTLLLLNLVRKCIFPKKWKNRILEGLEADVVYINTDLHFDISKLVNYLQIDIDNLNLPGSEVDELIESSLKRLNVINIYDGSTFLNTINFLKKLLCMKNKIGLIVFDSISAFYWQDNLMDKIKKMNTYLVNIIKQLNLSIGMFDVTVIYSRPNYFKTKFTPQTECSSVFDLSNVNTVVELKHQSNNGQSLNLAQVRTGGDSCILLYKINDNGIVWTRQF